LNQQISFVGVKYLLHHHTGWDEQNRALKRTILIESPSLKADGAHILEHENKKYVAPWSTAARCWSALEDFKSSLPASVFKFFLPQSAEDAININSDVIEDKVSHIITSTWNIPPRWFALFEPSDRLRGENSNGVFTILRTSIANAKQRCTFAHESVKMHLAKDQLKARSQIYLLG
jgi:hypothetical protein